MKNSVKLILKFITVSNRKLLFKRLYINTNCIVGYYIIIYIALFGYPIKVFLWQIFNKEKIQFHKIFNSYFCLGFIWGYSSGIGITCGAHRLWTHNSYKAKWQLKLLLLILFSKHYQNSIYNWARDHR